ncbi:MAG: hypothetical protein ACYCVZ_07840 [Streptosporangiaceae bacterium]
MTREPRACLVCDHSFTPTRRDETTCSSMCARALVLAVARRRIGESREYEHRADAS